VFVTRFGDIIMPGSRPGSSRQSYQGYTFYEPVDDT